MIIGVLSDTHGLLRPEVLAALEGCDMILHGGDINKQSVLDRLEQVAPVRVVRGNNDKDWAEHLPYSLDFKLDDLRVFMTHKKKDLPEDLTPYDLVILGHTHKYSESRIGATTVLNPGCCGPRRPDQPITMAIVSVSGKTLEITKIDIPHR